MKNKTNINLFIDVNQSTDIDGYVNAHINYIKKKLIQKTLGELEMLLDEENKNSNFKTELDLIPKKSNKSSNLKCYQIQIDWIELEELNIKSQYVKENFDLMNCFIEGGDIKKIKEMYEFLNN